MLAESNAIAIKQPKKINQPSPDIRKIDEIECDGDAEPERCKNEELKREDAKLNLAYQQLMKSVTPENQAKVREIEHLWLQFVEKNCKFEASAYKGGSLEPLTYARCMTRNTISRTKDLIEQSEICNGGGAC